MMTKETISSSFGTKNGFSQSILDKAMTEFNRLDLAVHKYIFIVSDVMV